ncbi:MAG: 1,4-alpha-glucan branching protein GlgB [Chromatiales bacterium]
MSENVTPNKTVPKKCGKASSLLTDHDIYLLREGTHGRLYEKLGAHSLEAASGGGARFAVWAPNAEEVSAVGEFNDWRPGIHPLALRTDESGIWEGVVPMAAPGQRYKYHVRSRFNNYRVSKADPFAFCCETPPGTASIIEDLAYLWGDKEWMRARGAKNALDAPLSIYELHLGSWRRVPEEENRSLSYREMARRLADYVQETGFTHVEFLPPMEHPFYGSWGYQTTGYFAPTARYGSPQDFMYLIDYLHQRGIGVILDWVPSHFPGDEHGLRYFDGTCLYEHADPKRGYHPEWHSYIFNYGRHEVRAFLLSSALFWLDKYHVDGLRVDAVASMLYLDYGRRDGEWVPNKYGGNEDLDAIQFLRMLNEGAYRDHPDTQTTAEESTAWPMVSRPVSVGGLGFGMKWNMGWMHDTLGYFAREAIHRRHHHHDLTFSIWYAFHENFVLPLSHDEVVYGKGALIGKMPGDEWQQFANLRLLYGYMWAHPGKKLLFMGGELGQKWEWNHDASLEWHVLEYPLHAGIKQWVGDLNRCYRAHPALFERDFSQDGFQWVDCNDAEESVISFLRKSVQGEWLLVICNATPVVRDNYRVGVPLGGYWEECMNSDAACYGGGGQGNLGGVEAAPVAAHGRSHSLVLRLPPLAVLYLKPRRNG